MPKHGFLTPKAISNRIKAKGLQKLRWFCQMCEKQCRDENGFKCHLTSESHLRQMRVYSDNPEAIMEQYSKDFEIEFMDILSGRFGQRRVPANQVYQEFIKHKTHTHMNSSKWSTLTNFVIHLGKEGKAVVEETEKGWFISWINRDPLLLAKHAAVDKKRKHDEDSEERQMKEMEEQRNATAAVEGHRNMPPPSELRIGDNTISKKLKTTLHSKSSSTTGTSGFNMKPPLKLSSAVFGDEEEEDSMSTSGKAAAPHVSFKPKISSLESIMKEQEARKVSTANREERNERKENWIHTGIIVKVLNKQVGDGKYYKKKCIIKKVEEKYIAEVEMLDSGDRLRLDQDHLETVLPAIGGTVLIVNGKGRGLKAELLSLDIDNFCASIQVKEGKYASSRLDRVDYEDICRVAS
eukprot:476129_1